ncbi:heat shock 70 kDa protein 14-like [Oratosquilla oratoria]|uniref:heat shock 70 kDa protein 14-like n=1 Tax=Oratosquilla oratoria TaxID=337810 RepID=UPI003F762B38
MPVTFGIYVGASTCCIAVNKDGKVEVVANAAGDRVTPAVVAYHESEVVSGLPAKQGIIRHGQSTVQYVLKAIAAEDSSYQDGTQCQPVWKDGKVIFNVQRGEKSVRVTATEVLTYIFQLLKDIASTHTSEEELPLVLTVPSWANEETVRLSRDCAEKAGFNILTTVAQPATALLAYNLCDDNLSSWTVLSIHIGGTTVVASVLEVSAGLVTMKESITSSAVAGNTLTEILVKHFAKEFYSKYKGDPLENRRSKRKLYNSSENCKHVLSTVNTGQVYVESLWEGIDFSTTLSRARFEGLVSSTLSEFLQPAVEVVRRSGFDIDQVDKVVLSGGTSKIPRLQQIVSERFTKAELLVRIAPDEVLAVGAAIEGGLFNYLDATSREDLPMVPALAAPIFCMVDKEKQCVFYKGTPTHSRQSISFNLDSSSPMVTVTLFEGDGVKEEPQEEEILAQIVLSGLTEESRMLKLDFHLKSDGSLTCNIVESASKINKCLVVEAGGR